MTFVSGLIIPEVEREEDYVFLGGKLDRKKLLPGGDWRPYLPTPEAQATRFFDPFSCVSMSFNNVIETHLMRMMETDPEIKFILEKHNALDENGRPNFSDRWLAKISGTDPSKGGNSMDKVFDTVRKYGLVGENVYPKTDDMHSAEYYKTLPQGADTWGLWFLECFDFGYEKLPYRDFMVKFSTDAVINEALEYSPLWVVVDGRYSYDENGLVGAEGKAISPNHASTNVARKKWSFDSYPEFLKQFVPDYHFMYVKSINLKKKRMYYKIKGNAAVFLLNPVSQKFSPFSSGDVFKTWNGTLGYDNIITVDSLEDLLKIAPLDDKIIALDPWDSTSFTNSFK